MSRRGAPPPPPPKPRAPPPAVPQSRCVRREPAYCASLQPLYANERLYCNVSPVSSAYSELRRAAEPLYEPVGRAASPAREAEVDALTRRLVRTLAAEGEAEEGEGEAEAYLYGACVACGRAVAREADGCTAMDRVYHVRCFACCRCAANLRGKPFYALDGRPYCQEDYLNTLEKCSVCTRPILDRILRATGKPYHPACFACVVCGESLDGIPFTVDATNRIHCIEDFHKKFAPRCCVCERPIMPEPGREETVRVVALDRSFHIACYKCEDCGLALSSEAEGRGCYPLDDHVLCKSCNAKRVRALTDHISTEL